MAAQKQLVDFSKISSINPQHTVAWRQGMDIARIELDHVTLKRSFLAWVTENGLEDSEHFAALADWRYLTLGRMAWLMNNGAEMPEESAAFFARTMDELRKLKPEQPDPTEPEIEERAPTADSKRIIQYVNLYSYIDAVRIKYANDLEQLEELIRKRTQDTQAGQPMLRKLYQHYKDALRDALDGRDNPLVASTVEPLMTVVNLLATMTGNAAALGAGKKKVSARTIKAASKAKVKNLDADTNIVGLSPALLVGNSAALVYNTKSRKAMLYVAPKDGELGIKGTYITGYDEASSYGKTLRKPKETFAKLLHNANAKRVNEVLSKYIKGKRHSLNGKLNKDIMIIRVFK